MEFLSEVVRVVKGLAPAADRWNTNPVSEAVTLQDFRNALFLVHQVGGTTGKATLTVENCTLPDGTGATAIPFHYRVGAAGAGTNSDLLGALTDATASGFDTTPGEDRVYVIEVIDSQLAATKPYVRLKCTESANDPVTGVVEIVLYNPRHTGNGERSAL